MKLILVLLLLLSSVVLVHSVDAKSKVDKKAEKAIDKAIGKATEGKYSNVKMLNMTTLVTNAPVTVYNKSGGVIPPSPTPTPTPSGYKLCMAGDFKDSSVFDAMKKQCSFRIALGDNGYGSDLSLLKKIAPDKCVIGNHDAPEDGSSAIYKEALAYCGDSWWIKLNNSTLLLGFNTNGDTAAQLKAASGVIASNGNIKNIIAISHKNGHVFPNAHHPAEATALYSQLESNIPQGVKLWEIGGHNHDSASAPLKNWYIAGSGGKSFYACGKDADWTFCDNTHKAFLQLAIDNSGNISANFYDVSGNILH